MNLNEHQELSARFNSPGYQATIEEQERIEQQIEEEEIRISKENNLKWLEREKQAQIQWQELQEKLKTLREERAKQNARIKQEWEAEQKRLKELKELKEKQEQEKIRQLEILKEKIDKYIDEGGQIPEQLLQPLETNPNKQTCAFFKKTGACKFGDSCSRNHVRPGVSRVILIPNFFTHYSLHVPTESEYGNDSVLEYESREINSYFKEFFYDVLPEMEKCGKVIQFKVCCNHETHLRGNVYVEYSSIREAMKSFKKFQGRWYGGKQLNVEFSSVESWKSAICGLSYKHQCPKGRSCNFLHVFQNPFNLFSKADKDLHRTPPTHENNDCDSSGRNWRWSESPERTFGQQPSSFDEQDEMYNPENHRSGSSKRRIRSRRRSRSSSSRSRNRRLSRDSTRNNDSRSINGRSKSKDRHRKSSKSKMLESNSLNKSKKSRSRSKPKNESTRSRSRSISKNKKTRTRSRSTSKHKNIRARSRSK